jgi:dipeptide transport system ATP-binding protein
MLDISQLQVNFGRFTAVDGVDLQVAAGEVLGIVGESGSGKSVAMMALMGLVDPPGQVSAATLRFEGQDLLHLPPARRRQLVGRDIAMVFQDALASLNPSYTVGFQIEEVLRHHLGLRGRAARQRALELLQQVEIPDAALRLEAYPHELSGGMNQRVMIALAIACSPRLLIADEPTTALDVTIQAQVMDLLLRLQRERGMALVMITHDLAVVAEMAQRVAVMYAGQVVETGPLPDVFEQARHPYTAALLAAIPEHSRGARRLQALPGMVPGASDRPTGCLFAPRCPQVQARCSAERPALTQGVRCFFPITPPQPQREDPPQPVHGQEGAP